MNVHDSFLGLYLLKYYKMEAYKGITTMSIVPRWSTSQPGCCGICYGIVDSIGPHSGHMTQTSDSSGFFHYFFLSQHTTFAQTLISLLNNIIASASASFCAVAFAKVTMALV
jgi:hypothetical protein